MSSLSFRRFRKAAKDQDSFTEEEQSVPDEENSSNQEDIRPTLEEQLATIIPVLSDQESDDSDGEECELQIYENRVDTCGEAILLRAGTKSTVNPPKPKSHKACLVLTRHYGRSEDLLYTELEVQSRYIKKALRDVIGTYEGVDFTTKIIATDDPPMFLFHYQDELQTYAGRSDNQQLKSHMNLCFQYTEKLFYEENRVFRSVTSSTKLSFRHLWTVFKPGCLVYFDLNQELKRLRSITADDDRDSWVLNLENLYFCGHNVGLTHYRAKIIKFEGRKSLSEIGMTPLHLHPESNKLRLILLERGRKYLSLCRIRHCFYEGVARMYSATSSQSNLMSSYNVCMKSFILREYFMR